MLTTEWAKENILDFAILPFQESYLDNANGKMPDIRGCGKTYCTLIKALRFALEHPNRKVVYLTKLSGGVSQRAQTQFKSIDVMDSRVSFENNYTECTIKINNGSTVMFMDILQFSKWRGLYCTVFQDPD